MPKRAHKIRTVGRLKRTAIYVPKNWLTQFPVPHPELYVRVCVTYMYDDI